MYGTAKVPHSHIAKIANKNYGTITAQLNIGYTTITEILQKGATIKHGRSLVIPCRKNESEIVPR